MSIAYPVWTTKDNEMDDVKKRDKRSLLIALVIAAIAVIIFATAIYMGAGMQPQ